MGRLGQLRFVGNVMHSHPNKSALRLGNGCQNTSWRVEGCALGMPWDNTKRLPGSRMTYCQAGVDLNSPSRQIRAERNSFNANCLGVCAELDPSYFWAAAKGVDAEEQLTSGRIW
jgi:hypothetical protein